MRVVLFSTYFQPAWDWGGPVRSMWNLTIGLRRRGVDVVVITTDAKQVGRVDAPSRRCEEGVEILTAPVLAGGQIPGVNRIGLAPKLVPLLIEQVPKADLVHVQGFWGVAPALACLACRLFGRPYVISPRGNLEHYSLQQKSLKKKLAMLLWTHRDLAGAAALHFTTKRERQESRPWGTGAHDFVVPNPVEALEEGDRGRVRDRVAAANDHLLLGMFGRIHPHKGFDVILPALADTAPYVRLAIVGPDEGHRRQVEAEARRLGIRERVVFTGLLQGQDLADAYAGVDLLVAPSHEESFGNVVVEAVAQGTPVLVSDRVGLRDWVEESNVGEVLPLDVRSWREAVHRIDPAVIRTRWNRTAFRDTAQKAFSTASVAQQMLWHYETVVAAKKN